TKVHVPRSTSARLPEMTDPFVSAVQASAGRPATRVPEVTWAVGCGPQEAVPTEKSPAMPGGELTVSSGVPAASVEGTAAVTEALSQETRRALRAEVTRTAPIV